MGGCTSRGCARLGEKEKKKCRGETRPGAGSAPTLTRALPPLQAFTEHFTEWRHAHGMRQLGIPNTKHFMNIVKIDDAKALWEKLQSLKVRPTAIRARCSVCVRPSFIAHVRFSLCFRNLSVSRQTRRRSLRTAWATSSTRRRTRISSGRASCKLKRQGLLKTHEAPKRQGFLSTPRLERTVSYNSRMIKANKRNAYCKVPERQARHGGRAGKKHAAGAGQASSGGLDHGAEKTAPHAHASTSLNESSVRAVSSSARASAASMVCAINCRGARESEQK